MKKIIGIRREDKNRWEKRAPLVPADVQELREKHGIETIVQPSDIRIFPDEEYRSAGARISEDLGEAAVIFAVKEIPPALFEKGKTYVFFSHTIKGQPHNMDMLKRLMDLRCNLIDYECIRDNQNVRLIAFGAYAGMAGMIETLHAYGQKMKLQGHTTPLEKIQPAYRYASLSYARESIREIGSAIAENGFSKELHPLTVGFTGYGKVSTGAQKILDLLPVKELSPAQLREGLHPNGLDNRCLYQTVFKEEDMVVRRDGGFELEEYYSHPERYCSRFDDYLAKLAILVNCIYWTDRYPRVVTRESLKEMVSKEKNQRLQMIGDISCDIGGSVEITRKVTEPGNACYTYQAEGETFEPGVGRSGITVMAIDNLPGEFPKEASGSFSSILKELVPPIAACDYGMDLPPLPLREALKKALIVQNGSLTPPYQYMAHFL